MRRLLRPSAFAALSLCSFAALFAACNFPPVPMVAKSGTTITLPLSADSDSNQAAGALWVPFGYESEATLAAGIRDFQRGEIVIKATNQAPTGTCLAADPCEFVTRLATRAYPDPASNHRLLPMPLQGNPVAAQVIVVVDIPLAIDTGTYTLDAFLLQSNLNSPETFTELPLLPAFDEIEIEQGGVLPRFTPFEGWGIPVDLTQNVAAAYPNPKLGLALGGPPTGTLGDQYDLVAAAHVVLEHPAWVEILSVSPEPDYADNSFVVWRTSGAPGSNEITIDVAALDKLTHIAVVFELVDDPGPPPTPLGTKRAMPGDFEVTNTRIYDLFGNLLYEDTPQAYQEAIW